MPKKCPKLTKKGAFHQKWQILIQNMIHSLIARKIQLKGYFKMIFFGNIQFKKLFKNLFFNSKIDSKILIWLDSIHYNIHSIRKPTTILMLSNMRCVDLLGHQCSVCTTSRTLLEQEQWIFELKKSVENVDCDSFDKSYFIVVETLLPS